MKCYSTIFLLLTFCSIARPQADTVPVIGKYSSVMIPMRDGVKLYTVILSPLDTSLSQPIVISRTPYGAWFPRDSLLRSQVKGPIGFVVSQDIRGRWKSEGQRSLHPAIETTRVPATVDETTDTWDTIDWLIKNLKGHNNRVSISGTSYGGWLALVAAVDPHPALSSIIETAGMADLWLGDDFFHNGAFRLSYGFEYTYMMDADSNFSFPASDLYTWYLELGPLKNVNQRYFHAKIKAWNDFIQHPAYDAFWKKNSPLSYLSIPTVPILHQGGYYDPDDLNGPQLMYKHLEKKDAGNNNYLLLGPWNHAMMEAVEDSSGKFVFRQRLRNDSSYGLVRHWYRRWLFGTDNNRIPEATCFQTGSNKWKSYDKWPPKAQIKKLYINSSEKCSFEEPGATNNFKSFVSDPAHPVPYRPLPIDPTQSDGWMATLVEDQRFVSSRPDVISFISEPLADDLVVTGNVVTHLFASTSGTDADWVVKLIDVYPPNYHPYPRLSGYQFPVTMEVFRGRYRKSFSNPSPLVPNKPEEFVIDLHDINHVFRKGHQLMIQVQSSWFPVIDRNPQKYVPNIFLANESDFVKAEHRVYFSKKYPSRIELPVLKE